MSGFHFGKLPFDCPSVDLEINSVNEGSFAAGSTINLTLTDGTNPVTPESVTVAGNDVEVEVSAGAAPSGRELMKTGQTISFRTGDDGDLQEGRDVDFFTLDYTNPFGNTNRFTDELGGTAYANDIVIDWSTYNAGTGKVLGWHLGVFLFGQLWDDCIDISNSLSVAGFTSGWRLPNIHEIFSIYNFGIANRTNYHPFNIKGARNLFLWTSTTDPSNGGRAYASANFTINNPAQSTTKTTTRDHKFSCRTFTVSGTTLT
jgi:hypothetical protein